MSSRGASRGTAGSRRVGRILDGLCSSDREDHELEEPARFPDTNEAPSLSLPWSDHPQAGDMTRVYKYLLENPAGVPVTRVCEAVYGELSSSERCYTSTQYERVRRFLENSEIAALDRSTAALEATPTLEAFHLTHGKQISNLLSETPETEGERGCSVDLEEIGVSHKQFAQNFLARISSVDSLDKVKAVTKPYLRYLENIEDTYLIMEDQISPSEEYLLLPYRTRFNDDSRKADQWRRYHNAWDKSLDLGYRRGLHLTITTDPKRYDHLQGMVDGLFTAWGKLLEALNSRSDSDERLPFIRALEFTGSAKSNNPGLPHLHVVVFGVGYIDHEWLSSYMDVNADHCSNVWIEPLVRRDDTWLHKNNKSKKGQKVNAKAYLGEYLSKAFDDIGKLEQHWSEMAEWETDQEAYSSSIWKMAMYWATGRQFWDSSHSLKEETVDCLEDVPGLGEKKKEGLEEAGVKTLSDVRLSTVEDLEAVEGVGSALAEKLKELAGVPTDFDLGRWKFVGAASYSDIPFPVLQNATLSGAGGGSAVEA